MSIAADSGKGSIRPRAPCICRRRQSRCYHRGRRKPRGARSRSTTASLPVAAGWKCRKFWNCGSVPIMRSVGELRERLTISGDLDPHASAVENNIYDSYLEEAVRRFQARHGLTIDGVVHEATFDAMNVPAATRRGQLKVNIERLKTLSTNLGPRYVVANIPAARVEAIQNDVVVSRHAAVAGKPDRPSPDINSKIIQINFNPYWTV